MDPELSALATRIRAYLQRGSLADIGLIPIAGSHAVLEAERAARIALADVDDQAELVLQGQHIPKDRVTRLIKDLRDLLRAVED